MKPKFHARIRIRFLILYMILGRYGLKRWYGTGNCLKIIGSVPDAAVVRSVVQDIQRIFSWFCTKFENVFCAVLWHNEPLPLFEKMVRMVSSFTPQQKIKVYQNWFTLKYCHQVTTDVVKLPIRIESVTPILVEVDWDKSLLPKLVNPIDWKSRCDKIVIGW